MKPLKKIFKWLGIFVLLYALYVLGAILHGTLTDKRPPAGEVASLAVEQPNARKIVGDSTLTFITWNVGYGGLGAESDFFYDDGGFFFSNGHMVRATKELVDKNVAGARSFLAAHDSVDFFLLQEVDVDSRRSYRTNEYQLYGQALPSYSGTFAWNFDTRRVPIPVMEPWNVIGKAYSGLATYARYTPSEAQRIQLPGEYAWPTRIFQLDRCAAVHRFPTANGKELLVINAHNSAYDEGGVLKKQQMTFLKEMLLSEYGKGNYVVVGGDWNQCPPNFPYDTFSKEVADDYEQSNIAADFLPQGWTWAFDPATPTNRKLNFPYTPGRSFTTLIDFFLTSPNISVERVQGVDQQFGYSDHQPTMMRVRLK
jgi:endonuclease/exonuclease/phosphatase family metal-dependent hydrolase